MEIARESRSRSRTPFLGDAVNTDMTSNVEGSARVTRRTDKPKPTNGLTNGGQEKTETVTTGTETVTVIETKAAKDIVNRNKAKPASKKLLQKEVSKIVEKDIDMKKTVHKEEKTEKKKSTSRKLLMDMGDYSSDEEAKMRTVTAYRAAGEWWEAFPKTDYTYSPASLHRQQQVAPGVKALPNMSRRSLASVAGKHDSSAFVSSTATSFSARKATTDGATPPLPYMSHWKGGRWHTFGQLSDGESDAEDERAFASSTRTETTTTTTTAVSVWTTITTTVISLLVLADPRRALNWALDYLYLVLAYVRVLDARILNALPARPRKAVLVPLLLLPLFLLCGFYFWHADTPLSSLGTSLSAASRYLSLTFSPALAWLSPLASPLAWLSPALDGVLCFLSDVFAQAFSTLCLAASAASSFFSWLAPAIRRVPSTFIEFFSPLYNLLSPMLDLQLTLPNIY